MIANPVRWFEIYVQDMERAKAFYQTVFSVKLEKIKGPEEGGVPLDMWTFPGDPKKGGCNGALVKIEGVTSGGCSTIVYFGSDDCAVEERRVSKAGGSIHRSKMAIGQYGFITLAVDTEGNMFGIHSLQ